MAMRFIGCHQGDEGISIVQSHETGLCPHWHWRGGMAANAPPAECYTLACACPPEGPALFRSRAARRLWIVSSTN
jgi:hypothetical protein